MLAANQSPLAATATQKGWDRARLSVVVPISVIVVVAIVCIVVAVLTSAQRADEVALNHDKRLLTRSITNHGERILRELESVAVTDQAVRSIRNDFDQAWIQRRVGLWLKNFFDHDFVFVADTKDELVYALLGRTSVDPRWFNSILPELAPTVDYVRGRAGASPDRAIRITEFARADQLTAARVALVQQFLGRPAVVAAVLVVPTDGPVEAGERQTAPIVLSVKFIDEDVLAEIANRLQLKNLRKVGAEGLSPDDHSVDLADDRNNMIARFAWTPKRPGAEIVQSVIPFIAVALAGFALLAGLIFGYMRRTTATIAASENSLRYLALHDPLCGLPNRNYFGERLQAVIKEVQRGGPSAAVFYIDLDHFKDVNDTLGHPVGDELIRNVTFRLSGTLRSEDLVARLGGDEFAVISSLGTDTTTLQSDRQPHHLGAVRALLDQRPQHRHRRQHRHRHHRQALGRRRRRYHALCRHGALSRQERRPQSRLHLRRGDGRRPVASQAAGT